MHHTNQQRGLLCILIILSHVMPFPDVSWLLFGPKMNLFQWITSGSSNPSAERSCHSNFVRARAIVLDLGLRWEKVERKQKMIMIQALFFVVPLSSSSSAPFLDSWLIIIFSHFSFLHQKWLSAGRRVMKELKGAWVLTLRNFLMIHSVIMMRCSYLSPLILSSVLLFLSFSSVFRILLPFKKDHFFSWPEERGSHLHHKKTKCSAPSWIFIPSSSSLTSPLLPSSICNYYPKERMIILKILIPLFLLLSHRHTTWRASTIMTSYHHNFTHGVNHNQLQQHDDDNHTHNDDVDHHQAWVRWHYFSVPNFTP